MQYFSPDFSIGYVLVTFLHASSLRKGLPCCPHSLGGASGVGFAQKRQRPACHFCGSPGHPCHLLHPQLTQEQGASSVGPVHAAGQPKQQWVALLVNCGARLRWLASVRFVDGYTGALHAFAGVPFKHHDKGPSERECDSNTSLFVSKDEKGILAVDKLWTSQVL